MEIFIYFKQTNRSPWQKSKMAAKSKMATESKMAANMDARQTGNNNTTRTGPFQGAKFATFRHYHFCDFFLTPIAPYRQL